MNNLIVIPAKAVFVLCRADALRWVPAFAGMTRRGQ